jgi:hypothetical protein
MPKDKAFRYLRPCVASTQPIQFQEIAVTKNLSKLCLPDHVNRSGGEQPLTIEFKGKPKNQARVVWARETGNRDERVVGVELVRPLREI